MDHSNSNSLNRMASSATLHCLTGCAIGEVSGLIIGTAFGLSTLLTITLAIVLAFLFGYALSTLPLIKSSMGFFPALSIVFAADTLSIATMEIVDNLVMILIPGALHAGIVNPLFWVSMPIALTAAYFAAYPVNRYLLQRNKGHALLMEHHEHSHDHHSHGSSMNSKPLLYGLIGFFLAGFIVAVAATTFDAPKTDDHVSLVSYAK